MAQGVVAHKEHNRSRTKVKTGCGTCRIRKVKCDEGKPFCKRCVSTGRTCEGYQSPFRFCNNSNKNDTHMAAVNPGIGLQPIAPPLAEITPEEIDLLNRYFSTKTICNVNLHCDQEARQLLHASLTDSSIRHAVSSLRALREDLEVSRDSSAPVMRQTPSYNYGLEQYSMALAGLASTLSSPGSNGLKSTLLCCQIFVSIEEVQGNFDAMVQHVIQGLRIVREYRVRPSLTVGNTLVPAHHDQLPLLDVFIIKLFAAPCKFAEPPPTADVTGTTSSGCSVSPRQPVVESRDLRTISPVIRTVLTRIASSTLQFLSKVSQVASVESAIKLLPEKAALVDSLRSWLVGLQAIQTENRSADNELISVSFVRMFHLVLKIVLLGALGSSPDLDIELQTEADRLQAIAKSVGERLKAYRMFSDG